MQHVGVRSGINEERNAILMTVNTGKKIEEMKVQLNKKQREEERTQRKENRDRRVNKYI